MWAAFQGEFSLNIDAYDRVSVDWVDSVRDRKPYLSLREFSPAASSCTSTSGTRRQPGDGSVGDFGVAPHGVESSFLVA